MDWGGARMGLRLLVIILVVGAAAVPLAAGTWQGAIAPIDPPAPDRFDGAALQRGLQLAAIGNCMSCHTAAGGAPFAGGRPVATPYGTIYSSNITPDAQTGIGQWSEPAFRRALRAGVSRTGQQLYPAFPYDHFTLVSDADDALLYAYLMTRRAVRSTPPANQLRFPFSIRPLLALWKFVFFKEGAYRADPTHDGQWNRGAYLANGLGHCGACHTPRNALGAEKRSARFAGGRAQGWHGYAIDSASPARVRWDRTALRAYFRDGWQTLHGDAHGPMAEVVENLSAAAAADLDAIAIYIAWTMGKRDRADSVQQASVATQSSGAVIFASACQGCHDGSRPLPFGGVRLALSTAVMDDEPTNLINVVLEGLYPRSGAAGAIMPGFASVLSDEQLRSLLSYVRLRYGQGSPWKDLEASVQSAKAQRHD